MTAWSSPVTPRSVFRAVVERLLPWYDPAATEIRDQRTEAIRVRSIGRRIAAEREMARADYAEADRRLGKRDDR